MSVRLPWAWAIFHGKDVENRGWRTSYAGPLLIHVAQTVDEPAVWPAQVVATEALERWREQPRGVLLGVVQLVEVITGVRSAWAEPGAWHWQLADPRLLPTPVPWRGRPGLFWPDRATLDQVRRQLAGWSPG